MVFAFTGCLAVEEESPGDGSAAPGDAGEAGVAIVVPDCLQAADAAEGGELDEEVGVKVEELPNDVVLTVGGGAVDRSRVPPLIPGALPP